MKNKIKLIDGKVIAWFIVTFAIVYGMVTFINALIFDVQVIGLKCVAVHLLSLMIMIIIILLLITTIKVSALIKFIKGVKR